MLFFKAQGHKVISLSQLEGVDINPFLKSQGIEAYSYVVSGKINFLYFYRHLIYFVRFCIQNKVTVVFSHLDSANFVAAIGQYFIRAKVFLCRHHIDEAALYNYHLSWTYRLTNWFAQKIIVVSQRSLQYMVNIEKVALKKLIHINLAYDFSLYQIPEPTVVEAIRNNYKNKVLIVTVCRLTKFKRPELSLQVLRKLKEKGVNAHLIILGAGEMREQLEYQIEAQGLIDAVFLPGYLSNALDYISASDFVLHPSVLESSCVVIKEAGLVSRPVIVCRGVGDFDEYIINGQNGILVDKDFFVDQASEAILIGLSNQKLMTGMGMNLSRTIEKLFDIKNVASKYYPLMDMHLII
jgi:glycosyltransferase involved in cell wall biosynthesis